MAGAQDPVTLSKGEIVNAVMEKLEPRFEKMTAALSQTQRDHAKTVQEQGAATLAEAIKTDPNSARFLSGLLMSPKEYAGVLSTERDEALRRGAGLRAARIARGLAVVKEDYGRDLQNLPKALRDVLKDKNLSDDVAKGMEEGHKVPKTMERFQKWAATGMTKAMTITDPTSGGFWTKEVMVDDFIPLLRPKTVMGQLRMRPYPMDAPRVIIPRMDAASQGYWVGESKKITVSQGKAGRVTLNEKYAGAFIVLTRQLMRSTNPAADAMVRDDILKVLKLLIDNAAIQGVGGEFQPLGLLKNTSIQTQSIGARVDPDTMLIMLENLWAQNVPMLSPATFFNSKLQRDYMRLRDANGQFIFKNEMQKDGTLEGCNWAMSTQIATGTDANGMTSQCVFDASEYFYGDFQMGFNLDTSNEASYYDETNTVQNLLQNQETALVATYGFDTALRHDASAVKAIDIWTIST